MSHKKVSIKLGPKAIKNFGYSVEDVGSKKTTYHGSFAKAASKALHKTMKKAGRRDYELESEK